MTRIALGISLAIIALLWWALVEAVRKGRAAEAQLAANDDRWSYDPQ